MKYIAVLIIISLLTACSTKPHIVKTTDINVASTQPVYVVNHGWHTGFMVPADAIIKQLPQLRERFGSVAYIEFGWGDKEFYQAEEITAELALQAILWPTDSVIHAVGIAKVSERYYAHHQVQTLCLDSTHYARLLAFLENSFYKNENGKIIPLTTGVYGNSHFYQAEGDYFLMNTCNKWTAKGLRSAGINISTTFKLTSDSIMDYLSDRKEVLSDNSGRCQVKSTFQP